MVPWVVGTLPPPCPRHGGHLLATGLAFKVPWSSATVPDRCAPAVSVSKQWASVGVFPESRGCA